MNRAISSAYPFMGRARFGEPPFDHDIGQPRIDFLIQFFNDIGCRSLGAAIILLAGRLVTGNEFA
jgi:hypothetical protein